MLSMTAENVAVGRVVAGSVYLTFPAPLLRAWVGPEHRSVIPLGRAIGARDLALGLGALTALRRGEPTEPWFQAAFLSDAVDAVATLFAFRDLPRFGRWIILAAAVTGATTSRFVATHERRSSVPASDSPSGDVIRTG